MNRSALKKYAPQARLDFIEAVTLRTRRLGLDPAMSVSVEQTGDVLLIDGQPFPSSVAKQRSELARRIQQQGFSAVIEALAYTWFNRLVAIRFMELKGYLSHGYRVLSHPQGQQPEILDHVQHLDLPGLDKAEVIRLKTAGNQDEALYREILLAQCHELHRNMPFLFEALDDATELLLPDNLLRTDSPIAHLIREIEEADWQEVEVIGWLYQFYISDKKDEVMGKVVKSEDIPAATQLFTPNWIVQYLVQNSLGRLWLMANPGSSLKEKMPYYIEPVEQTADVQTQLDAMITVRMDEDGGTLNPESLTVLDPACGSGHILVEAYSLLRAIYEERGYRRRDIPRLILQKNLYGLDIDDRAAQLAGFALLMKAREDDHRLFDDQNNPPHLNVMAVQQSAGLPDEAIAQTIMNAAIHLEGGEEFHSGQLFGGGQLETQHSSGLTVLDLRQLIRFFEHGKTFGSLISVPEAIKAKLGNIVNLLALVRRQGDDLSRSYASQVLEQFAWPASLLALKYDAVIANPPYMGAKNMNSGLKKFAAAYYPGSKADLYSMFLSRSLRLSKPGAGFCSLVTMQGWMFLSSFDNLRKKLIDEAWISSLTQIGYNSFPELNSKVVQACAFVIMNSKVCKALGVYVNLNSAPQSADKKVVYLARQESQVFSVVQDDFNLVSGWPITYWMSAEFKKLFRQSESLSSWAPCRKGMFTGDNSRFLKRWWEVASDDDKYKPYNKGGEFRRWYGNFDTVILWGGDGAEVKGFGGSGNIIDSMFFKKCVTWTLVSSSKFSARIIDPVYVTGDAGPVCYPPEDKINYVLGYMNTPIANDILGLLNPTLNFSNGVVGKIPLSESGISEGGCEHVSHLISLFREDWDSQELSAGFKSNPLVFQVGESICSAYDAYFKQCLSLAEEARTLETYNNNYYSDLMGLPSVGNEVAIESVSLLQNPYHIYGTGKSVFELNEFFKRDSVIKFISYSLGCLMGRYSLDTPGLIYAHGGKVVFDPSLYVKFPADSDGIIPITDESWFEDDAAECVREFVNVVWGTETLVENMEWLADSLSRKSGESADDAIRRYLSTSFYKDHQQTYKKRPIYWLFSSGKQKAFECLVYLHRYNEGTLSRMRMEYVVPLQSRMQARIDKISDDIDSATSSAQQKALQKHKDKLTKQLEELRRFDETLRPYADQRITINLDDGIKNSYGKFGTLLADVKIIAGGKDD